MEKKDILEWLGESDTENKHTVNQRTDEDYSNLRNLGFAKCSRCKKERPKLKFTHLAGYYDFGLNQWKGHACPKCKPEQIKENNKASYLKKKKKLNTPDIYNWTCECCKKDFTTTYRPNSNQYPTIRYCSGGCRDKQARLDKEGLKNGEGKCNRCGEIYTKEKDSQRRCSDCKKKRDASNLEKKSLKQQLSWEYARLRESSKKHGYHTNVLRNRRLRRLQRLSECKNCLTCDILMPKVKKKYCSKKCTPRSPAKNAARKACKRMKRQRKLSCVTWNQIAEFYAKCPEGHEVDHIIPLNHEKVSGLHVIWNFQYLPKDENQKKSNKFNGTYENK